MLQGFGAQGRAKGLGSVGLRVWHLGFRSVNVPSCYRFENSVSGLRFVAFRLLLSWFGISSLEFGFQGVAFGAHVAVGLGCEASGFRFRGCFSFAVRCWLHSRSGCTVASRLSFDVRERDYVNLLNPPDLQSR